MARTFDEISPALAARLRDRLYLVDLRRRQPTLWNRFVLGLALVGPGILVMLGDNDAGGVITYAQTGASNGLGIFIPLLIPLAFIAYVVQEMTIRLGAVTRRGHAELIWKRYGAYWGAFSLFDLVVANILTLMTEFIGIRVAGEVFGVSAWITVPAAVAFVAFVLVFLRYWRWERVALVVAAFNLIFVPVALLAHPDWGTVARTFVHDRVPGGVFSAAFLMLVSANIGTTIAPWQLFFQQSCVVDKGLLAKDIDAGRRDLALGVTGMVLVALAIIVVSGQYIHGVPHSDSLDIRQILQVLQSRLGSAVMVLFALGLAEAGLIAAVVITASTAWAVGEAFEWPRSINDPARQALGFYIPSLLGTALAGAVVLLPNVPLGFLNLSVQVIATIFMPAAMLFLLMLLNDRELMGPYVNSSRRNAVSLAILFALIACNVLYGIATLFPNAW
jgi:Mn2+/Fe2+ NRAMP family transporter